MFTLLLTFSLGCRIKTEVPLEDTSVDSGDPACTPAAEVCDGIDNDCDGLVDADDADITGASVWFADSDDDGYGDANSSDLACEQPAGFVEDATDCDDAHAAAYPGADENCDGLDNDCDTLIDGQDDSLVDAPTWYSDSDADGYGAAATDLRACDAPAGTVGDSDDCDDGDATVNPGVDEVCDGVDNDCDGLTDGQDDSVVGAPVWYADADSDGYGAGTGQLACNAPRGTVDNDTDCDDAAADVNPSEVEVCDDVDNDCDGLIDGQDDSVIGAPTWYTDADSDGYGDASTAQEACNAPRGTVSNSEDCNDGATTVNPGEAEVCDSVDNDCDALIDGQDDSLTGGSTWYTDADSDGYGDASSTSIACTQPPGAVANSTDCDDSSSTVSPGAPEICDDIDDDCDTLIDGLDDSLTDGVTWYYDADGDGYGDASTTTESCSRPPDYVGNDLDCDDTDGTVGRCTGAGDDGSVCSGRWGTDDGQVPTWTGTCDTTAGFSSYGGHCYYAVNTSISSWDDARASCAAAGGSLAIVTDTAETNYVYSIGGRAFAGGCDDDVEGTWTWVNGEPWSYEAWGPGEPNDSSGTEECLEVAASGSGGWNDIWCTYNSYGQHYVCEFE